MAWPSGRPRLDTFETGDRIVGILGRDVDAWAGQLLDPGAIRPTVGVEDSVALIVARDGQQVPHDPCRPLRPCRRRRRDLGAAPARRRLRGQRRLCRRPSPGRSGRPCGARRRRGPAGERGRPMLGLQALDLVTATGFWLYAVTAGLAYAVFLGGVLRFALVFPRPHPVVGDPRLAALAWPADRDLGRGGGRSRPGRWADARRGRCMAGAVTVLQVAIAGAAAVLLATSYRRLVDPVSRLQLGWPARSAWRRSAPSFLARPAPALRRPHPAAERASPGPAADPHRPGDRDQPTPPVRSRRGPQSVGRLRRPHGRGDRDVRPCRVAARAVHPGQCPVRRRPPVGRGGGCRGATAP